MRNIITFLTGLLVLASCQNDDNGSPVVPEFMIAAEISDGAVDYEQTVFDGGSNGNINVFNRADRTLYLQSFKNGKDDLDGFLTIRLNGVDIETLTLPYSLTGVEGSVTWVDEAVKELQGPCAAPDVLCFYAGVGVDEVKVTITAIENNIISGNFEGKLYHIRVNPSVVRDENDIVEVVKGEFNIQFETI